ncbi:hypothetical protein GCM10023189_31130 [Nibrella saemangeumensis]|uniref:Por secretion system C-terminal sorting domain-containing protein n=1 Tax=Nibrella saemangeumensis TaxID=1084526 RepID=A0ABP8MZ76_9BACT
MVVQRNSDNQAPLHIAGTFTIPVDRIEVRLTPVLQKHGRPTNWLLLQADPKNGVFEGTIQAEGGWYTLDVRGMREGRMVSLAQVERVGVGEVFLVAGQSNAMGVPNLGSKSASERVVSFDAINWHYNKNDVLEAKDNPFPVPKFTQLRDRCYIYPMGEAAWAWSELGDMIADRFGVPVAFFNASCPSTVAENWSATANGIPAVNIFNSKPWPYLQPYTNLRNTLQYFHSQFGIRALLWFHGESDAIPLRTSTENYRRFVQDLINATRRDYAPHLTWVVAKGSVGHATSTPISAIINAQNQLIQTPGNNVWPGPDSDGIQVPRPSHGHFENVRNGLQGISLFAASWNQALTDDFFKKSPVNQPWWFLRTGLIPAQIPAGTELPVPFSKAGFENASPDYIIQLLDGQGQFISELGRGKTSPVRLRIPDTLSPGTYRFRVVSSKPVLPGVPSAAFRVVAPSESARTLLDAQAETVGYMNEIHWLTAQEPAGGRFVVERQDSLGQYQPLGAVQTRSDGGLHHLYSITDRQPLPGANRYRVRHELPNGKVYYSAVVITSPIGDIDEPFLFPNPTDGHNLLLRLPESGNWQIAVLDLNGRVRWQQSLLAVANRLIPIPLPPNLTDGMYMMQIQNTNHHVTKKLIIHR